MRSSRCAVLLAVLLVIPVASATWRSYGGAEPGVLDIADGYMFTNPPGQATNQVYFNVASEQMLPQGGPSPNSATLGSRIEAEPRDGFFAILGIWVDCNHDGYVGFADGALVEYRVEASALAGRPVDATLCPAMAETPENEGQFHQSGGWVTELLPIRPAPRPGTERDFRTLVDPLVRVWGDETVHGATAPTYCGGLHGAPDKEHASHTGGMLATVDCLDGGATAPISTAMPDANVPGPSCSDAECRESILRNEFDCRAGPVAQQGDIAILMPNIPSINTGGSLAATIQETYNEAPALGQCDPVRRGGDVYVLLDAAEGHRGGPRMSTDAPFVFEPQSRIDCQTLGPAGCGAPTSLGVFPTSSLVSPLESNLPVYSRRPSAGANVWVTRTMTMPLLNQPDLPEVSATRMDIDRHGTMTIPWTFYASTFLIGGSLPHPAFGVYGAEWCDVGIGSNAPSQNGWSCDPGQWNVGASGIPDPTLPAVGDLYTLRDVDCYDNTIVSKESPENPTGTDLGLSSLLPTRSQSPC